MPNTTHQGRQARPPALREAYRAWLDHATKVALADWARPLPQNTKERGRQSHPDLDRLLPDWVRITTDPVKLVADCLPGRHLKQRWRAFVAARHPNLAQALDQFVASCATSLLPAQAERFAYVRRLAAKIPAPFRRAVTQTPPLHSERPPAPDRLLADYAGVSRKRVQAARSRSGNHMLEIHQLAAIARRLRLPLPTVTLVEGRAMEGPEAAHHRDTLRLGLIRYIRGRTQLLAAHPRLVGRLKEKVQQVAAALTSMLVDAPSGARCWDDWWADPADRRGHGLISKYLLGANPVEAEIAAHLTLFRIPKESEDAEFADSLIFR